MIAVDTSVVVAAFASWHEAHAAAAGALAKRPRLPAHAALECYSVLTRLPPPHRAEPGIVAAFLAAAFTEPYLTLPARRHAALIRRAAETGISGSAVYDALIAATARHAGAVLLTRDGRAASTYRAVGAAFELVT